MPVVIQLGTHQAILDKGKWQSDSQGVLRLLQDASRLATLPGGKSLDWSLANEMVRMLGAEIVAVDLPDYSADVIY